VKLLPAVTVNEILVTPGDAVEEGQVLVKMS
jgi:biotin carboxyl carrier protein